VDAFAGRHIKVAAETRLIKAGREQVVVLVALSPSSALVQAREPIGEAGDVLELFVPVIGGKELRLTAGVDRAERADDGFVAEVEFMFDDAAERRALDDLVALLLGGTGGGRREHPRVTYGVPVRYGERDREAELVDVSVSGAQFRAREALAMGALTTLAIPNAGGRGQLTLRCQVRNVRPADAGRFAIGVQFLELTDEQRADIASLLRTLLSR
jgi:hypothetical protein